MWLFSSGSRWWIWCRTQDYQRLRLCWRWLQRFKWSSTWWQSLYTVCSESSTSHGLIHDTKNSRIIQHWVQSLNHRWNSFFFFSSSFHLSFLSFMELIPWASWPPTRTTWDSVECVPRRRCRPTGFLVVRKERVMTWLWRLCWEHIRMEVWLWVPQLPRTSRECWWA